MGEVYKAKDTRLDRTVAIKVLPAHLSENLEFKQRFEREARAISQLSHPHICALYDVGSQDGVEYLVMELLEGQTVAERLEKGALAIDQVLKFGIQIADALDRAHRARIIHRDLKPANIMLTKSGVKLLDFGLAKFSAPPEAAAELSSLPTEAVAAPLTELGTVMGTFQYMAPEQLEGCEADGRTDIFSFGCVLYEMATGKKAFTGRSRATMIAAILEHDPAPMSSIQPMTPPALDHVVRRCFAKEPDDRWQSAADVASELRWVAEAGSQAGAPATVVSRRKSRERKAWGLAVVLFLLTVVSVAGYLARTPKLSPVIRSSIQTPEKQFVSFLALSPDGARLVFSANAVGTQPSLWVRRLDDARSEPIPGTEEATFPFWSPDGQFLAFFADKKLKKVDLSGGPVVTICEAEHAVGGTWGRDGTILFAPNSTSPLFRVPSAGGKPAPVTKFDQKRHETTHRYPHFLPDGRHFLYTTASLLAGAGDDPANAIRLGSLTGGDDRVVVPGSANSFYSSEYVFYAREGTLFALPFDAKRLVARGEAFPLAQKVSGYGVFLNYTPFAISETGLLVFQPDVPVPSRLLWFDRGGKELGSVGEPDLYGGSLRLSPEGKRLAVDVFDSQLSRSEVWVVDLSSGARTRLVSGDSGSYDPVWSPDGDRVAFTSDRKAKGIHKDTRLDREVAIPA
jgi:serine/threonine protein kinase